MDNSKATAPAAEVTRAEVAAAAAAGGAVAVGVAALSDGEVIYGEYYSRAVVAAVALSRGVVDTCRDAPTRLYAYHYRAVNAVLDNIACRVASFLEARGWRTLAVPASQIVDWDAVTGAVSYQRLGQRAGLGFIGRHNLLVMPTFGAAVRLVAVFTDAPLAADEPAPGDCGACRACVAACPAAAIGEDAAAWSKERCLGLLRQFKKNITNQFICGVCVRVCRGPAASQRSEPSV